MTIDGGYLKQMEKFSQIIHIQEQIPKNLSKRPPIEQHATQLLSAAVLALVLVVFASLAPSAVQGAEECCCPASLGQTNIQTVKVCLDGILDANVAVLACGPGVLRAQLQGCKPVQSCGCDAADAGQAPGAAGGVGDILGGLGL